MRSRPLPGVASDLGEFLIARLTDDLARIWSRDAACLDPARRPGMAAQVAVVDELLQTLRAGRLPERRELRILLFGYAMHPDFDPSWWARVDSGSKNTTSG